MEMGGRTKADSFLHEISPNLTLLKHKHISAKRIY